MFSVYNIAMSKGLICKNVSTVKEKRKKEETREFSSSPQSNSVLVLLLKPFSPISCQFQSRFKSISTWYQSNRSGGVSFSRI